MDNKLSSKQTSEKTGLSIHTLRYYEKIGLIQAIERDGNGYRRYTESDIWWFQMIGNLRAMGMPIGEMLQFLTSQNNEVPTITASREFMETYRGKVADKMKEIQKTLKKLDDKIDYLKELEASDQPSTEMIKR